MIERVSRADVQHYATSHQPTLVSNLALDLLDARRERDEAGEIVLGRGTVLIANAQRDGVERFVVVYKHDGEPMPVGEFKPEDNGKAVSSLPVLACFRVDDASGAQVLIDTLRIAQAAARAAAGRNER